MSVVCKCNTHKQPCCWLASPNKQTMPSTNGHLVQCNAVQPWWWWWCDALQQHQLVVCCVSALVPHCLCLCHHIGCMVLMLGCALLCVHSACQPTSSHSVGSVVFVKHETPTKQPPLSPTLVCATTHPITPCAFVALLVCFVVALVHLKGVGTTHLCHTVVCEQCGCVALLDHTVFGCSVSAPLWQPFDQAFGAVCAMVGAHLCSHPPPHPPTINVV